VSDAIQAREKSGGTHERCAYCHEEFSATKPGDEAGERVVCAGCRTPHHGECFADNGGCSSLGCDREVVRVADGSEIGAADLVRRVRLRAWPDRVVVIGAIVGVALTIYAVETDRFPLLGPLCLVLAFSVAIRRHLAVTLDDDPGLVAPFAPARPPLDAIEAAQRLNATATRASTGTLREPTGPSRECRACSRTLEATDGLRFCYHCGALLR
jgi:hypothetical protein